MGPQPNNMIGVSPQISEVAQSTASEPSEHTIEPKSKSSEDLTEVGKAKDSTASTESGESGEPETLSTESALTETEVPLQEESQVTDAPSAVKPSGAPNASDGSIKKPIDKSTSTPKVTVGSNPDTEQVIDLKTGKDQYQTAPVPEGKAMPVEPQDVTISDKALTATLSISAEAILNNIDLLDKEKVELVPEDGVIFSPREVTFYEGESVFNLLLREMKQNKIHMEFVNTPIYNSAYIEGINNLYEFDCGELSGWMYKVNGWFPNYGSSRYQLQEGDVIEWVYTCDLGRDVGDTYLLQNGKTGSGESTP